MRAGRIVIAASAAHRVAELRDALAFEGYRVADAETASQAEQMACSGWHELIILDSLTVGMGTHQLCRTIRTKSNLGIILLNHDDSEQGRIDALNAGADDCVPPQFVLAELLARVRALLRRVVQEAEKDHRIVLQDRAIDFKSHKINGPGSRVSHLTPKEFLVLKCLVTHTNQPQTHQSLAQAVWQRDGRGQVEYMRIVIKQLRRKIESNPESPRYILTERSVGYRFHVPPVSAPCMSNR
jgi:two-component system KDP operon response regulator KdpE